MSVATIAVLVHRGHASASFGVRGFSGPRKLPAVVKEVTLLTSNRVLGFLGEARTNWMYVSVTASVYGTRSFPSTPFFTPPVAHCHGRFCALSLHLVFMTWVDAAGMSSI